MKYARMEAIISVYLWFVYFSQLQSFAVCQTYNDTRTVHETVLRFYENGYKPLTGIIPLEDQSAAMSVVLTMHLYSVDGFDAVTGQVEISGSLYMEWSDESMAASIGNYNFPYSEEGIFFVFDILLPSLRVFIFSHRNDVVFTRLFIFHKTLRMRVV